MNIWLQHIISDQKRIIIHLIDEEPHNVKCWLLDYDDHGIVVEYEKDIPESRCMIPWNRIYEIDGEYD